MPITTFNQIKPGLSVSIVLKADQRTGKQVQGTVSQLLTRHNHPRGIKVKLTDGRVGRVQQILGQGSSQRSNANMSSNNNPWADSVSQSGQHTEQTRPHQQQPTSQTQRSFADYQESQNQQENPWGGQPGSQGYSSYSSPYPAQQQQQQQQQPPYGFSAPQGAPPSQGIRRSDTEQLLAQESDRAEQVEHMQQYEASARLSEDDRNQAELQKQFPNIDSSLIAAIYNERKPDLAEVRELLQELNSS